MWKWTIIVLIMMSLIGSVMWAMPTRRQTEQAQLRSRARTFGFQVQLVTLEGPRASGEAEPEEFRRPAYRLLRHGVDSRVRERLQPWRVFRVRALSCDGLPDGWSWTIGERMLDAGRLELLAEVLQSLPHDVVAVESTPIHVSALWGENGGVDELERIRDGLQRIIEGNF
ncbi:hypothetical protein GCM10011348_01650 [Marinobacterium nitratireducens]|uniref:Uncharacterized protein n=1 Tax=Marinobacterium nitratireducens TaxID=518897 RepID=A0A917Z6L0_9GAMM|nr:hypothetical protein [Marinobacterium nitratireducens]GGO75859.1 hypothetical protein GCM10011348_01650 [Marinobacterium nitratireducens]